MAVKRRLSLGELPAGEASFKAKLSWVPGGAYPQDQGPQLSGQDVGAETGECAGRRVSEGEEG